MKRSLFLCIAAFGLVYCSAYAHRTDKFEYAARPSFGVVFIVPSTRPVSLMLDTF